MKKYIPPQGDSSATVKGQLQALEKRINQYKEIGDSTIIRATIIVDITDKQGARRRHIHYPPGNIPDEFKEFFQNCTLRFIGERNKLEANYSMYKVGNLMLELGHIIKASESTDTPLIDGSDIKLMENMIIGQSIVIGVDGLPTTVTRIS